MIIPADVNEIAKSKRNAEHRRDLFLQYVSNSLIYEQFEIKSWL